MQSTENAAFHTPSTKGIPDANPHTHTHTHTHDFLRHASSSRKRLPPPPPFFPPSPMSWVRTAAAQPAGHTLFLCRPTLNPHTIRPHTHTHRQNAHAHTRPLPPITIAHTHATVCASLFPTTSTLCLVGLLSGVAEFHEKSSNSQSSSHSSSSE